MIPPRDLTEEPFEGSGLLFWPALVLLIGVSALVGLHTLGMEHHLVREVARTDLEGKVEQYSHEARRLLQGSRLHGYLEGESAGLAAFDELVREAASPEDPAVFFHSKDRERDQETVLFKAPGLLQQITVTPNRVELLEGDGRVVRRMVVQEGEAPPRVVELDQPMQEVLDDRVMREAFRSPHRQFRERIQDSRKTLRNRFFLYALAGLLLVTGVFAALSYQLGRIRHLEAQVRRQKQLAYLGTLAGGLAHEIRNPLNGIGLNLHLLEETMQGADERLRVQSGRFIGRIRPALDHLERIVTEFLDFARPRPLDLENLSLEDLARQVVDFLEPRARELDLELELRVEAPEGVEGFPVRGDRERLRQVLLNLVQNAFQASPSGGAVTITLGLSGPKQLSLRVRDQGDGIPAGKEEEIFRLFYTTRDGGLGLGLPIVRRVVEDHGGTIQIEPGEGPGACFLVRLPLGE